MKTAKRKSKAKDEQLKRDTLPGDLEEMTHAELAGPDSKDSALSSSSTDEDEDEGVGDGNIGRSTDDILKRK